MGIHFLLPFYNYTLEICAKFISSSFNLLLFISYVSSFSNIYLKSYSYRFIYLSYAYFIVSIDLFFNFTIDYLLVCRAIIFEEIFGIFGRFLPGIEYRIFLLSLVDFGITSHPEYYS
jgi:hypothetical protein